MKSNSPPWATPRHWRVRRICKELEFEPFYFTNVQAAQEYRNKWRDDSSEGHEHCGILEARTQGEKHE